MTNATERRQDKRYTYPDELKSFVLDTLGQPDWTENKIRVDPRKTGRRPRRSSPNQYQSRVLDIFVDRAHKSEIVHTREFVLYVFRNINDEAALQEYSMDGIVRLFEDFYEGLLDQLDEDANRNRPYHVGSYRKISKQTLRRSERERGCPGPWC